MPIFISLIANEAFVYIEPPIGNALVNASLDQVVNRAWGRFRVNGPASGQRRVWRAETGDEAL